MTSRTPLRCATCHEWGYAARDGRCKHCDAPWDPQPLDGPPTVTETPQRRQAAPRGT